MHENDYLDDVAVARRKAAARQHEPGSPDLELPSQLGNREFVRQVVDGSAGSSGPRAPGAQTPGAQTPGAQTPGVGASGADAARPAVLRSAERSHGAGPLDPEIETDIRSAQGGGRPLDEAVRGDMESHLGTDLSSVRVHADSTGDTLSRSVQAEAFTTGSDVFFRSGKYTPESSDGRKLLVHELTHVAQQASGGVPSESRVSHPDDSYEREAAAVADTIASAPVIPPAGAEATSAALQREAMEEELDEDEGSVSRQEAGPDEELEDEDRDQGGVSI